MTDDERRRRQPTAPSAWEAEGDAAARFRERYIGLPELAMVLGVKPSTLRVWMSASQERGGKRELNTLPDSVGSVSTILWERDAVLAVADEIREALGGTQRASLPRKRRKDADTADDAQ